MSKIAQLLGALVHIDPLVIDTNEDGDVASVGRVNGDWLLVHNSFNETGEPVYTLEITGLTEAQLRDEMTTLMWQGAELLLKQQRDRIVAVVRELANEAQDRNRHEPSLDHVADLIANLPVLREVKR